jgi:thiamine phosphate synthase YjbQ (UPF0047 family)
LTRFVQNAWASLFVQENADPGVPGDLERFLARLAPPGEEIFRRLSQRRRGLPAHVRAVRTETQLSKLETVVGSRSGRGRASICGSTTSEDGREFVVHLAGE